MDTLNYKVCIYLQYIGASAPLYCHHTSFAFFSVEDHGVSDGSVCGWCNAQ